MNLREGVLKGDEEWARLADAFRSVHDKMYGYTPDSPGQNSHWRRIRRFGSSLRRGPGKHFDGLTCRRPSVIKFEIKDEHLYSQLLDIFIKKKVCRAVGTFRDAEYVEPES